jgi:hypothetical protein
MGKKHDQTVYKLSFAVYPLDVKIYRKPDYRKLILIMTMYACGRYFLNNKECVPNMSAQSLFMFGL